LQGRQEVERIQFFNAALKSFVPIAQSFDINFRIAKNSLVECAV
jgi:hypothetical protein